MLSWPAVREKEADAMRDTYRGHQINQNTFLHFVVPKHFAPGPTSILRTYKGLPMTLKNLFSFNL